MSAREEVLRRIREALRDVPDAERPEDVAVPRAYRRRDPEAREQLLERLAERLCDYHASAERVSPQRVGEAVADACARSGLRRLVVPPALPVDWRPAGIELIEDGGLGPRELDVIDGALTGCAVAIAETGTLVLDGQGTCGRRAITLVPDHHICVVLERQVVGSVPEAIAAVAPAVHQRRAPITMISGPSGTSDIELSRVEGVHGPRHLLVLIVG
jgi:L-lactate dehydrogenase complex protein LldG